MKDTRPDQDPRRLSDLLRRAVPDGPDPMGRADQVVRRARHANRRRGTFSALAVGVVAASVIVGPHLLPSSPVTNTATPTTSPPTTGVTVAHPYACPTPDQTPARAWVPRSDNVPAGAVLARLCPLGGPGLRRWTPPLDALTTNLQVVADSYNFLPPAEPLPCPHALRNTGYTLTFQYPGGRLVRLTAKSNGYGQCDFVSIDGQDELGRARAGNVTHVFLQELQRQRAEQTPPALPVTPLACPPARSGPGVHSLVSTGRNLDLAQAIVCSYEYITGPTRLVQQGSFTPAQLQLINRSYTSKVTAEVPPGASCMNPIPPDIRIVGRNIWGDPVELVTDCYVYTVVGSQPQLFWPLSHGTWRMIDSVLGD